MTESMLPPPAHEPPTYESTTPTPFPGHKPNGTNGKGAIAIAVAAAVGLLVGGAAGYGIGSIRGDSSSETAEVAPSDSEAVNVATGADPELEEVTGSEPVPNESERGNLIKKVGERAGIGDEEPWEVDFTVTDITVDPECTGEYAKEPENGHFVKFDYEVTTSKAAEGDFSFAFWKWIRPDGTTLNGNPVTTAGRMCLTGDEMLPDSIGPAEKASGSIIFDLPDTEGTLVSEPAYAGTTGSWSWEWAVPAE